MTLETQETSGTQEKQKAPMKRSVVILSDDFVPHIRGGAGAIATSDAQALAQAGYAVTVITTVQDKSLAGSFTEDGMRIERLYASPYNMRWRAYRSLHNPETVPHVQRILAEVKPEIVHAHNVHEYISYAIFKIAKQSGAKVFLTAHDVMAFHYGKIDSPRRVGGFEQLREYRFRFNPFRTITIRRALTNCTKIFTVSQALQSAFAQNGITNTEVLYNGIATDKWIEDPQQTKQFIEKRSLQNKKTILFSGRISGAKGGDVLVLVMEQIAQKVPEAVLLIAGRNTEYVRSLQERAAQKGFGQSIQCTDWLSKEEMRAAYYASHVVAVPSQYLDPLPTVVLEAMACGKPVVGSRSGGIPEMIEPGVTGYVEDATDTERLTADIYEVLMQPEKAQNLGAAGCARVQNQFSERSHLEKLLHWYT